MKRITPQNSKLWIVNYKRHEELTNTINYWLKSFDFEEVNIISNHSSLKKDIFPEEIKNKINIFHNWHRHDWMIGSIAQCWNLAMLHTFHESNKNWVVLSQDDNIISRGWDEKINNSNYDTYIAPHGDTIQILSFDTFRKNGWFDERFRTIGGPEADYLLRLIRNTPNTISVYDNHEWKMRHNLVGLEKHFFLQDRNNNILDTRKQNVEFSQRECFDRWIEKWNIPVDQLFLEKKYNVKCNFPEIDWYPSFTKYLINEGRL